MTTFGQNMSL